MSVEIISNENGAVFFCNTSMWAFGPVMPDADVAEAFLRTFQRPDDPRHYNDADLEKLWSKFRGITEACPHGHWNKVDIDVSPRAVTFNCYAKGCNAVWDIKGNALVEEVEA